MQRVKWLVVYIMLSFLVSTKADAAEVNITGEITRSTCQINGGKPLIVDFGDNIHIANIKKRGVIKPFSFAIICITPPKGLINLKFSGEEPNSHKGLLKTSSPGLAIGILENGSKYPVNTELNFSYDSQPLLMATLYLLADDIEPGPFNATAMITIEYS
ncbi:fimbrial protein [Enterobacter cancerogenus]|uniref:fimbrial protein n=1 Tax=Enterobacter cancerogenus TaxID=69218 RepID=UPI000734D803|nr:fimbrial protein [Enterobacter cancerogenus]KTQ46843.1 hypothetical protein NS104_14205 [Enterobacter cancerogenus]KTQ49129.1 hypothetical protein NS111_18510 [Enterobacter cancerogenus]KTQ69257.1 hypothetical protein NS188_20340 [Enterobacter cancerogenus]KTQ80346.1 hypothetical protein NS31R_12865 [Enterobacter cancerogenus]